MCMVPLRGRLQPTTLGGMDMTTLEAVETIESVEYDGPELEAQHIEAWQTLVDSGIVWQLQGWYGRTATDLIKAGIIHAKS